MVAPVKKWAACAWGGAGVAAGRNYSLSSPSGVLKIDVSVSYTTAYAVWVAGEKAVFPSRIGWRFSRCWRTSVFGAGCCSQ